MRGTREFVFSAGKRAEVLVSAARTSAPRRSKVETMGATPAAFTLLSPCGAHGMLWEGL